MAKTFKDFITECELYPHSKECYDLMKECSEIQLMAQFIENQQFYENNQAMLESVSGSIEDGYFQESVAEDQLQVLEEKFSEKVKAAGSKIWAGVKKLWETLKTFFVKIANKFDESCRFAVKLRKSLQGLSNEARGVAKGQDSKVDKIVSRVGKLGGTGNTSVSIHQNQLKVTPLKKFDLGFLIQRGLDNVEKLAAIVSDTYVVIDIVNSKSNKGGEGGVGSAVSADAIADLAKQVMAMKNNADAEAILQKIDTLVKDVQANGLRINVNRNSIQKVVDALNSIRGTAEGYRDAAKQGAADEQAAGNNEIAEQITKFNQVYSRLVQITKCTINAYNGAREFITNGQAAIGQIMELVPKAANGGGNDGGKDGGDAGADAGKGDNGQGKTAPPDGKPGSNGNGDGDQDGAGN